ncbi:MAG: hypothetical protein IKS00_05130 [Bacteroidales bacterium]|nr:hypothetical protein [Bacteroidales bacterium]
MKKIFCLVALCVAFLLSACEEGYDTIILGKWVLQKVEIVDIDDFCEYQSRKSIEEIDKSLKQIDMEIQNADPILKANLEQHRSGLEQQKALYVVDSIKADFDENFKNIIGQLYFQFRSNKTFALVGDNDSLSGSWSIKGDTIYTLLAGKPTEDILIRELTKSKLSITSTEIDDDGYEITTNMVFNKE